MNEIRSPDIPQDNILVARHLYCIEVALRELIIESLHSLAGTRWYKQRLPEVVWKESLKKLADERKSKWTQVVNHHPLYYTNFAELKVIIERHDNWRDVFQGFFESREVFVGTLAELDPIRNKVAHNRRATNADVQIAKAASEK